MFIEDTEKIISGASPHQLDIAVTIKSDVLRGIQYSQLKLDVIRNQESKLSKPFSEPNNPLRSAS